MDLLDKFHQPIMTSAVDLPEQPKHSTSFDHLIACRGCDLLHHRQQLASGQLARCARCGDIVQTRKPNTVNRTLPVVIAGIILLLVSLSLPLISLSRSGFESNITVLTAVGALWSGSMPMLGILTLALIVLLPLTRFVLLGWVLWRLRFNRKTGQYTRTAFRWAVLIEPWAMADIFMLGIVVSLVKISALAYLQIELAFWSLLTLVALSMIINILLCRDTVWILLNRKA